MNLEELHKIIADPHDLNGSEVDKLNDLVDKYPFFNAGHILLAKAGHVSGDLEYESYLRKASLHAGDRKVLYDLIMKPALSETIEKFEKELEDESFDELSHTLEELQSLNVVKPEPEKEIVSESGPKIIDKEIGLKADHNEFPETESSESNIDADKEEEAEGTGATPAEELEKEILLEAVQSTIKKEVVEDIDQNKEKELLQTYSSYTAWLLQRAKSVHFIKELPVTQADAPREKLDAGSLIDRFIQKDPQITRASQELYSTENLGKMSLIDDESFVTETLAKVYARQGKINKAIKAYKVLSLKYPEKSIYFADRIAELKSQPK